MIKLPEAETEKKESPGEEVQVMQITETREIINRPVELRNKILVLFIGLLLITFKSCSNGEVYFRYHQINKGIWYRDSVLTFSMDSIKFNPLRRHDFTIELTTADIYPYKDIWFQVEHNLNDSVYRCDTLHSRLADDYNKWLGSGTGGLHQLSLPYKSSVALDTSRVYVLKINQLMNNNPLKGIEKVGIKVVEY